MATRLRDLDGIRVAVLTVSDSCFAERRRDESGPVLCRLLKARGAEVAATDIVGDQEAAIAGKLRFYAKTLKADLILTTGGTGLGPRDVTPEATRSVIQKEVQGIAELMRIASFKKTDRAALSRAVAGICGKTLVVNFPGSPKGAAECFLAVAKVVPHALAMMRGQGHA
jgi:molybdopterin adenylyltransferase